MEEILVVDDDRVIRTSLKQMLEEEGYAVRTARDGDDALAKIRERRPSLVLLDVMMPRKNGFAALSEIRASDQLLPVIFLTAMESETAEVKGMGLGADDYIQKSASQATLIARIERAIARAGAAANAAAPAAAPSEPLRLGDAVVDFARRCAILADGSIIRLTGIEAGIITALAYRRPRSMTCAEIIAAVHGEGYSLEDSTIRSQIFRLKAKLGAAGDSIRNERSLGYSIT